MPLIAEPNRARWPLVVILLGAVFFGIHLARIGNAFGSDSLIKYIQAYSLLKQNFQSEELFYPGKQLDPGYRFFPFRAQYLLQFDGRNLGQYPIFFSAMIALPVAVLPPAALPFLSFSVAFIGLFLYWRLFQPSTVVLAFAMLGTPLITHSLELTEGPFVVLSGLLGLFYSIRAIEQGNLRDAALAGFFSAIGIWLRLEALLYSASILAAWILITWRTPRFRQYAAFALASGIVFVAFMAFNAWDYGHPLGTRFIANLDESRKPITLLERLLQATTLIFGWKQKLGFFGYSPLFLLPLVYFAVRAKADTTVRILIVFHLGFLITSGLVAPNDGIVTWGSRYMALAIFPSLLLLDRFFKLLVSKKGWLRNALFYTGMAYSIVLCFITLSIQRHVTSDLKALQREIESAKGDIIIFPSQLIASYSGLLYLRKPTFAVWNPDQMQVLVDSSVRQETQSISFIEYSGWTAQEFAKQLQIEFGQENSPAYMTILGKRKKVEARKLKHLTIHEFAR